LERRYVRKIVMTGLVGAAAMLGSVVPALTAAAAANGTATTSVPSATARLATTARTPDSARSAAEITFSMFIRDRISCASPTACLAVGLNTDSAGNVTTPEAESLHGTAWRPVAVKAPKGALSAMLNGVSCKAATFCLAVGTWEDNAGTTHPAAWTWNGTALTPAAAPPMPSGSYLNDVLSAVSCVAVKSCVVIGSAYGSTGTLQLVWTWNGKSWARKAVTLPGTSDGLLTAAHCFTLTSCVVGGITTPATGNTDAESLLLASWNGKAFTPQQAGAVSLVFGSVSGVSCSSPSHCAAVGVNTTGTSSSSPMSAFAEVWNGARWTATKWTGPKGAPIAMLSGVSCTSPTSCVAAGMTGSERVPHAAALSFNGTRWSVLTVPSAGAGLWTGFEDLSCPKPGHCVAIGRYGKVTAPLTASGKLLAGYWNGKAWKLKAA
jgi:hypothetical protein